MNVDGPMGLPWTPSLVERDQTVDSYCFETLAVMGVVRACERRA
jgi:hypothetical protein